MKTATFISVIPMSRGYKILNILITVLDVENREYMKRTKTAIIIQLVIFSILSRLFSEISDSVERTLYIGLCFKNVLILVILF